MSLNLVAFSLASTIRLENLIAAPVEKLIGAVSFLIPDAPGGRREPVTIKAEDRYLAGPNCTTALRTALIEP